MSIVNNIDIALDKIIKARNNCYTWLNNCDDATMEVLEGIIDLLEQAEDNLLSVEE